MEVHVENNGLRDVVDEQEEAELVSDSHGRFVLFAVSITQKLDGALQQQWTHELLGIVHEL